MTFFHDKERGLLIYDRPSALVEQHIPEAKRINGSYVAVPQTLRNSQVLRWLGYAVAPVMDGYTWPAAPGVKPWESQRLASNFLALHPRCANLSDMGGGKTLTALWSSDFIMDQYPPGTFRTLIIAPLSILRSKWANDIFKHFLGRRTYEILHGDAQYRLKLLNTSKADYLICNHDGVGVGAHTRKKFELDGFSKALAEREDIGIVICDEASAYKDSTTKRHRIARLVFGRRDYAWFLTGTPTPNAPTDAFGIAKLINGAHGQSFRTFQESCMTKVSQFKWVPRKDGYEQARRLLTPSIRFEISDIWDGPELTTRQREVPLTLEQKKALSELKRDLQVAVKTGALVSVANEAAARTKLIQISLGAIYDSNHKAHRIDATPRIEELKSVIEQAPSKVLVMVPLTSVVEMLYKELRDCSRAIVNGNVTQRERTEIFRKFQDEADPRVLIADPATMAHGLDLYAAQTVVWYGITEKAELYAQANARAHRPGQRYPVSVIQLVSNPLEKEIFRRLENNLSLQGALLEMVAKGTI